MSLRRLKLERIELYQLHRIDPRTPLEESLAALRQMQDQGKIRHIGLSEVSPAEIEQAQKIAPIVSVQNRYSLADRRHEQTLTWCEQRGIAFFPWYPMAGGKLLKPDHPFAQILTQLASRYNATPAQLAIAWLLHRSPVMLPIPGTSQISHLEENMAAASLEIGPDEWTQLEAAAKN
jgi:aryl-alcohol dehydrogenase-like predicted oxidoreductase